MRWAIDVGNTQTVVGLHDGTDWRATLRLSTDIERTEDEFAGLVHSMLVSRGLSFEATNAIIASVVPSLDQSLSHFCKKWLRVDGIFLTSCEKLGLPIEYEPKSAVGADRLANALGALNLFNPPIIVVDFGTATTFDAIDRQGRYVGGAILPGPVVAAKALFDRTAKLPQIGMIRPAQAIGKSTVESLQSGIVLGYAYAINGLANQMSDELGGAKIIATGGLGEVFADICEKIDGYYPNLTLDGLLIGALRLEK